MARTANEIVDSFFEDVIKISKRGTKRNLIGPAELPVEERGLANEVAELLAQRCMHEIDGCTADIHVDGYRRIAGVIHFEQ